MFSVKESGNTSPLDPYVSSIFQYLSLLCEDTQGTDMSITKQAIGLLGDLSGLYGNKILALLRLPFVGKAIIKLGQSSSEEHRKVARWAQGVVNKALSSTN